MSEPPAKVRRHVATPSAPSDRDKARATTDLARVAAAVPTAYVEAPIAKVLATANHIVATELAFIQRLQATAGAPMSEKDAKRLLHLVSALEKSTTIGRQLTETELNSLSDAELETELLTELERIRAKKPKSRRK